MRNPFKDERERGVLRVWTVVLYVHFFDGFKWFPKHAQEELYEYEKSDEALIREMLKASERTVFRWLCNTIKDGFVEVDGQKVPFFGLASTPIFELKEIETPVNYKPIPEPDSPPLEEEDGK